jgi:hypothetical protein
MEQTIKNEIYYCENKAIEYDKDAEKNTGGRSEYWKGKADTHRFIAKRLKNVLEWHRTE